jgi:hypothetical protein
MAQVMGSPEGTGSLSLTSTQPPALMLRRSAECSIAIRAGRTAHRALEGREHREELDLGV